MRKGEIACNKQFLFFSVCFLPHMALIFHFKCTLKCHLLFVSIWTSLKFYRLVMGYMLPSKLSIIKVRLIFYHLWNPIPLKLFLLLRYLIKGSRKILWQLQTRLDSFVRNFWAYHWLISKMSNFYIQKMHPNIHTHTLLFLFLSNLLFHQDKFTANNSLNP